MDSRTMEKVHSISVRVDPDHPLKMRLTTGAAMRDAPNE